MSSNVSVATFPENDGATDWLTPPIRTQWSIEDRLAAVTDPVVSSGSMVKVMISSFKGPMDQALGSLVDAVAANAILIPSCHF